ncbi:MinD-like ATPase involved in chromosome partitioning or flagellar assembly [Actinoallomurus bryophytorum]|uniref:MinD-like ATPase involved in chromosome partitioning or flagellar assembly n=1 Tax=Actinoallomurus bryophytorum TaxID=1490222 RepID=A0A543CG58_9ACTN|nr:MinD-like ATPase involved in chromosome partitioning or flagellar assembly [Actinoallomurus bryophytorum]
MAPPSESLQEPSPAPAVPAPAEQYATRVDEEWRAQPASAQSDEPRVEKDRPASEQWGERPSAQSHDGPSIPAPSSGIEPPSAQVRSVPATPRAEFPPISERRDPGWSPPEWEAPPAEQQAPPQVPGEEQGWPVRPDRQADVAPNQASAWELASQTSWGLVAQAPWGTEPPPEGEPGFPEVQQPWDRSDGEAWQRMPEPQAPAPQPPASYQPPAPQDLVRRSTHGDPLVRRVSRGVRRAVGASAADEVRRTADVEQIIGRPVPSCRQIAVTSIRGGAGKTTVAGLTGTVISQYRKDRVLAVDADSGLGSLPLRLGVRTERSLHDLNAAGPRSFDDATRFLARTAEGLWVLSGTAGGHITHELDLATFRSAAGGMSRYFSAMVIDCGAGLLPELQRGILSDAHAQVLVTPGTVDGALSARGALEWQARNGYQHLLTRTVIAFVTHTPHVDADLTRAGQLLSGGGMPVVHMPYDRHLATGTAVESARIRQETRAAAIRVALEAFARATSV